MRSKQFSESVTHGKRNAVAATWKLFKEHSELSRDTDRYTWSGYSAVLKFNAQWVIHGFISTLHFRVNSLFHHLCSQCYAAQHSDVPLLSLRRDSPPKSFPTFSVRPRSSVGRVMVDLIRRSWVRFPPRSKDFFFTSCGYLIPFTRANAQWVIHGFISTLIYTSELILCFTICKT